jgi:hypothetical protein
VLEQPAEVRVVARARARGAAPVRAQRRVGQQAVQERAVARVVDLARQVLEEPVELVEVPVGDRQERGGIGLLARRPGDVVHLELQLLPEALDAPAHAHEVAAVEAAREAVRVPERPAGDLPRAVRQLERR